VAKVRFRISMSLDGFTSGPEQSVDNPLGIGGEGLHEWAIELASWRRAHALEGGEEMEISLAPILLGGGERLFDGVGALPELKLARTVAAPGVTHFKFARR
jgi:hypothetical protein